MIIVELYVINNIFFYEKSEELDKNYAFSVLIYPCKEEQS
jgi:hypothetical protein